MLIRRPGRSNGNLIVLESRSTFRETLTIRTGHIPASCSTRPSWTRTTARWPAPARMKSASKLFPVCFKSSWQVSTFWLATQATECSALIKSHPELLQHTTSAPLRIIMLAHNSSVGFGSRTKQLVYRLCFWKLFTEYRLSLPRSPLDCPQLFNQQPNAALVRGSMSAWLRRRFAANISTRTDCKWKIEVNGPCFVAWMPLMTWLEKLYLVRGRQWRLHRSWFD